MPKAALNLIFLCVWSEAYAGIPDGGGGLFLCPPWPQEAGAGNFYANLPGMA